MGKSAICAVSDRRGSMTIIACAGSRDVAQNQPRSGDAVRLPGFFPTNTTTSLLSKSPDGVVAIDLGVHPVLAGLLLRKGVGVNPRIQHSSERARGAAQVIAPARPAIEAEGVAAEFVLDVT